MSTSPCWCGEQRPYRETSPVLMTDSCAGTGELDCLCGGDQCVCHNHGTVACPGCWACDSADDEYGGRHPERELALRERQRLDGSRGTTPATCTAGGR